MGLSLENIIAMKASAHFRSFTRSKIGKVSKFLFTGSLITVLTRGLDVVMLALIIHDKTMGFIWAFFIGFVWCFVLSVVVIAANNYFLKRDVDITGLEELREKFEHRQFEQKKWKSRFIQWVLRRKLTIFLVFSVFYFDPDYTVLLIRDKSKGLSHTMGLLALSVCYSIWAWTLLYWYAVVYGSQCANFIINYSI